MINHTPKTRCWGDIYTNYEADLTTGLAIMCNKYLNKTMTGIEIGSFAGISSQVIANTIKLLYCIDPWTDAYDNRQYREINRERLQNAEKQFDQLLQTQKNIIKIKNYSDQAHTQFTPNTIDILYIDGAHDPINVQKDIIYYKPLLKKGALLAGHDEPLVKDILKTMNIKIIETFQDTSWISINH